MNTENTFGEELRKLRRKAKMTQAEFGDRLGISRSYVHQLEAGKRMPSEHLKMLRDEIAPRLLEEVGDYTTDSIGTSRKLEIRLIPVVGWAHAGSAVEYDELATGWQEQVPTECRDERACAVRLEGDSMAPNFTEGDLLVLMPETEIYSGGLAVLRLMDAGVIFRRVELRGEVVRLLAFNPQYLTEEIPRDRVSWAYPVWGAWKQVWKGK